MGLVRLCTGSQWETMRFLREEVCFWVGHSWKDVGDQNNSRWGMSWTDWDLRVGRKLLSSLFESICNLSSSEIVWSQRLMDSASTGWNGGGEMDGTEEMEGEEDSSWRPVLCLLSLWIHFILRITKRRKKGVTASYTTTQNFSTKLLLLFFSPYGNLCLAHTKPTPL